MNACFALLLSAQDKSYNSSGVTRKKEGVHKIVTLHGQQSQSQDGHTSPHLGPHQQHTYILLSIINSGTAEHIPIHQEMLVANSLLSAQHAATYACGSQEWLWTVSSRN
jgi:hypothetical protein